MNDVNRGMLSADKAKERHRIVVDLDPAHMLKKGSVVAYIPNLILDEGNDTYYKINEETVMRLKKLKLRAVGHSLDTTQIDLEGLVTKGQYGFECAGVVVSNENDINNLINAYKIYMIQRVGITEVPRTLELRQPNARMISENGSLYVLSKEKANYINPIDAQRILSYFLQK